MHSEIRLGAAENAFAQIVWERAPLSSGELVRICKKELNWARSTTYTVLHRLCDKGLFRVEEGTVQILLTQDEFKVQQSEAFMQDTFRGSLPAFIAAFTAGKKLNQEEAEEIRQLIDACVEEDPLPAGQSGSASKGGTK
ncbi:MAG: BlaI/MecI/CopY family transcriptional regulator [Lachnospiraceae bacterium]|nr:BlaI/MecI/CopY family transcriptional regulator [Lachnospiraceae bacterium]